MHRMPSRDALVRIWQEVALAREDASPVYVWARLKSAAISRNYGGLNPLPGKSETIVPWQTWLNRWNYRRAGKCTGLLREAIFALRADEGQRAFQSARLLHIVGATADVS